MEEIRKVSLTTSFKNAELMNATSAIYNAGDSLKQNAYIIAKELEKLNKSVFIGQPVDGFADIFDYSERMFGFKKSYVYRLIRVAAFLEEKIFIEKDGENITEIKCIIPKCSDEQDEQRFPEYSVTQIAALLPLKNQEKIVEVVSDSVVNSTMTVKEIKDAIAPYIQKKEKAESEESEDSPDEIQESWESKGEKVQNISSRLNDILYEYKSLIEDINADFAQPFSEVCQLAWEFNEAFGRYMVEYERCAAEGFTE